MNKDWIGNKRSSFAIIGASNHSVEERQENDYYATDPKMAEELLKLEPSLDKIWECACGGGHLAKVFDEAGKLQAASDIIKIYDKTYLCDFLLFDLNAEKKKYKDIVTNPPYKFAKQFIEKALTLLEPGNKVCMFLKTTFLEGKNKKSIFQEQPPKTIYISRSRVACAKNGDFEKYTCKAISYGWFVWEKGFCGTPEVKWFN